MNGPAGMTSTERKRSPRSFGSNVVIGSGGSSSQNNQNTIRDTKVEDEAFESQLAKQQIFQDQRTF